MSKTRKRRSAAEWSEIVANWKSSGESREAYAKRHGLNPGTLGWWRSQVDHGRVDPTRRAPEGCRKGREQDTRTKVEFAEVRVAWPKAEASSLEVVARSGHVVRVSGRVDAVALQTVLQAVEQC